MPRVDLIHVHEFSHSGPFYSRSFSRPSVRVRDNVHVHVYVQIHTHLHTNVYVTDSIFNVRMSHDRNVFVCVAYF